MADLNTLKEQFSLAYIYAVATRAGYLIDGVRVDRDSVDGVLKGDFGRRPRIEFQAKATARDLVRSDHIAFPLPIKNYDDLRVDTMTPRLLIVVLLPDDQSQWLKQSPDATCMRHCGYWLSLANRPPVPNTTTTTVHIPLAQVFDCRQLTGLMAKAEAGEAL